jgi:hypothetical protein
MTLANTREKGVRSLSATYVLFVCFSVCSCVAKLQRQTKIRVHCQKYDSKKPSGFRNIRFGFIGRAMRAAPIAVGGVSGGYGDDDRDRTFLGERRPEFSPSCSAVTRPPEMAAFSLC